MEKQVLDEVYDLFKNAYLSRQESEKLYLTGLRHGLEMIISEILSDTLVKSQDSKDLSIKKQPLESQIAFLYKRAVLPSEISALMHILRICGNYGTHHQEGTFNNSFSTMADQCSIQVLEWYYNTYREADVEIENLLKEVGKTVFVIHDNQSEREEHLTNPSNKSNYKNKIFQSISLDFLDVIKMVAVSLIVTFLIYYLK